ncbi:SusC/RagA family TonB-linked outer membrane protein [Flagellimonas allohymeniacidonis]|uniref:TonB-dependent receptor n=1 Tax=Flagellimonas allohymeniacidonis TaxID=2517819 RepID=A0A4Q8QJG6_9FLAO|nr:TonB-dependent receptor [Allomuricauda hymeniacidonis]TAI48376.1 TonB-dependent receptor [Allomuricauda hymeniacidonis]
MKKKSLFLSIFLLLINVTVFAQGTITVSGAVSEAGGAPLPGASIVVQGTSIGTQTDFDGNYVLNNVPTDGTLVFSYIGYVRQEVAVNNQTSISVSLQVDTQLLDEVVVIGYGTQQKADITGSIEVVTGDEVSNQPNANPLSSVQGRVAGVNITNSGRPGEAPNVQIRGVGSVSNAEILYVVDGVLTNDIQYLNPADIESMSILKDASSSAIYGIRAANGVIVIKTKKGTLGEARTSVTYDGFIGFQKTTNIPDLVNTEQYVQLFNEKQAFEGSDVRLDANDFDGNTDWFDEILRDAPITTSHNISVNGSTEKTRYYLGLGYFNQQGLLDAGSNINSGDDFRRITGRIGLDIDLSDYFTVGGSIAYTDTRNNLANEPFYQAYIAPPLFNAFNSDGSYGNPEAVGNFGNPRATLDFFRGKAQGNRALSNVYAQIKPIEDLQVRISFSGDFSSSRNFRYTPEFFVSDAQQSPVSNLERNQFENDNWLWENTVTWNKTIGKHDLTLLGGFSQEERISFRMQGRANEVDFTGDDAVLFLDLGNADTETVDDQGSKIRFQSFFGRLQYKYDNKYLLNATVRRDGSSSFPADNNTEIFPSVGIGWVISNESFMENSGFNSLKLKANWGQLGNANVPRGFDVTASAPGVAFFGNEGNQAAVSRSISEFSDPSIFWEIVEEYGFGLEFAMFNNRLSGEVNYFNRETQDAVFRVAQLASSGATNSELLTNAGSFRNTGVELSLNWSETVSDDFQYSIYGNLTTINNEITEILGGSFLNTGGGLFGNPIIRLEEGAEVGSYYGFITDGVVQTEAESTELGLPQGAFKFRDLNGDGLIGEDDKAFLGSPVPDFTYGFGFALNYRNFDFNMDFQGVAGNEIYNFNRNARFGNESWDLDFFENRWTPGSNVNDYPAPNSDQNSSRPSDFYVEKGDYFRIRTIQLGYTLPNAIFGDKPLWESLRIYFNAQNPLTLFSYNGFSPEINGGAGLTNSNRSANNFIPDNNNPERVVVAAGIDNNVYPLAATYNLGVNIKF